MAPEWNYAYDNNGHNKEVVYFTYNITVFSGL